MFSVKWSWLQSPSAVILEPKKIKSDSVSTVSPSISHEVVCRRRQWHPTPVLLPGKSHGRRSLVGCRPWGLQESDTTERLHFHFSLSCIGEGNANPLQCSCLENPRDGGAWWAAVYGVAQSRTRLKWLTFVPFLLLTFNFFPVKSIVTQAMILPRQKSAFPFLKGTLEA